MKIHCGTDIIEISRIKRNIETMGNKFVNRIFTNLEIEYCESKNMQKYQHYAVRFAAKEALFKAISYKLEDKYSISWTDIEIKNDKQGKPSVSIKNVDFEDIDNIDVSLSHCKEYAVANVIILSKD